MKQTAEPEILRCSLTSSILQLKCIGQNMEELDLMDKPDIDSSEYHNLRYHLVRF
jgi:ATP-dependent RNA helicase DHX33